MNQFEFAFDGNEVPALITVERTDKHIDAISLYKPDAPCDERRWRIVFDPEGGLTLQLWNDAQVACEVVHINRVGIKAIMQD